MKWILYILVTFALTATVAFAGPTWTPQTYQLFEFEPDDFIGDPEIEYGTGPFDSNLYTYLVAPTIDENPFGDPWAIITVDNLYEDGGYNPGGDYFYSFEILVGSGMFIPNVGVENPVKNIWVEIRYDPVLTDYYVTFDGCGYEVTSVTFNSWPEDPNDPEGWNIAQIEWEIRPNPPCEYLCFEFADFAGTKLDYIEVYTQCVPAPGAVLLGGIGVCLVGWLRRRRAL